MAIGRFRVELFDANNARLAAFTNVVVNNWERYVNKKGQITVQFHANDLVDMGIDLTTGIILRIWHNQLRYIGKFYITNTVFTAQNQMVVCQCDDQLAELEYDDVGANLVYQNKKVSEIIRDLILTRKGADGSWIYFTSLVTDDTLSLIYENESYLQAIEVIRKWINGYYALQTVTENQGRLIFGQFANVEQLLTLYGDAIYGDDVYYYDIALTQTGVSGYIFTVGTSRLGTNPDDRVAIIKEVTETTKPGEVVNRIIPNGAGILPLYDPFGTKIGESLLNLGSCNRSDITVRDSSQPAVGSHDVIWTATKKHYLIQDATSIGKYGVRAKVLPYLDIRPITNSAADVAQAANTLYDVALYELMAHKDQGETYTVTCDKLPFGFAAGASVFFQYKNVITTRYGTRAFKSIEGIFFVMSIKTTFDSAGLPSYTLDLSSTGVEAQTYANVVSNAISDISNLKLKVYPSLSYYYDCSTVRAICPITVTPDYTFPAQTHKFSFTFGPEVLAVNSIKLKLYITRLFSVAAAAASSDNVDIAATDDPGVQPGINLTPGTDVYTDTDAPPELDTSKDVKHAHSIPVSVNNASLFASPYAAANWDVFIQNMYANGYKLLFIQGGHGDPFEVSLYSDFQAGYKIVAEELVGDNSGAHPTAGDLVRHVHRYKKDTAHSHRVVLPPHLHLLDWGPHEAHYGMDIPPDNLTVSLTAQSGGTYTFTLANTLLHVISSDGDGEYIYEIDVTDIIALNPYFRDTTWTVNVSTSLGMGLSFIKVMGRTTIQPIQVLN